MKSLVGKDVDLSKYQGKVVLTYVSNSRHPRQRAHEGCQDENADRQKEGMNQCQHVAPKNLKYRNRLSVGNGVLKYRLGICGLEVMQPIEQSANASKAHRDTSGIP
jgi:hypothetical protein